MEKLIIKLRKDKENEEKRRAEMKSEIRSIKVREDELRKELLKENFSPAARNSNSKTPRDVALELGLHENVKQIGE